MSESTVKVNVRGTVFETYPSTLSRAPYFANLFQFQGAGKDTVFLDRDPKAFRHLLNLLTDSKYPFPAKYESELEWYGLPLQQQPVDQGSHDFNTLNNFLQQHDQVDDVKLFRVLYQQPELTLHRKITRRPDLSGFSRQGQFFNTSSWTFTSARTGVYTLVRGYIFLPSNFRRLKDCLLTVRYLDKDDNVCHDVQYHLDLECVAGKRSPVLQGYQMIPIMCEGFFGEMGFIFGEGLGVVQLELQLPSDMKSGVRLHTLAMLDKRVLQQMQQRLALADSICRSLCEHTIDDSGLVQLRPGSVLAVLWKVNQADLASITVRAGGKSVDVSALDFSVLPSGDLLPPKTGCYAFALTLNINETYEGSLLLREGEEFILHFPDGVRGRVWQFNVDIFTFNPRDGGMTQWDLTGSKVVLPPAEPVQHWNWTPNEVDQFIQQAFPPPDQDQDQNSDSGSDTDDDIIRGAAGQVRRGFPRWSLYRHSAVGWTPGGRPFPLLRV